MRAALIPPLSVLAGICCAVLAWAYPTGAPPGHAGAAGGADCSSCHFGTLDDASGNNVAPQAYTGIIARVDASRRS